MAREHWCIRNRNHHDAAGRVVRSVMAGYPALALPDESHPGGLRLALEVQQCAERDATSTARSSSCKRCDTRVSRGPTYAKPHRSKRAGSLRRAGQTPRLALGPSGGDALMNGGRSSRRPPSLVPTLTGYRRIAPGHRLPSPLSALTRYVWEGKRFLPT
jgi:hypothetical protein